MNTMQTSTINIIYYPTRRGYSGYSKELDGLNTNGKTIEELYQKIRYLIDIRVKTLLELGREKEANQLKESELIFSED